MNISVEGRIEQRAASQRMRFDRRVSLTAFAGCLVISTAYFLASTPEGVRQLSGPSGFAFMVFGIPAIAFLGFFLLRILMSPFIEAYYSFFRRKWHTDLGVADVLAEVLSQRQSGYLDVARDLLRRFEPSALAVLPVAHQAFTRLLDAEAFQEALDLGDGMGLPKDVVNQARRRILASWSNSDDEKKDVAAARVAVAEVLQQIEAIEGLVSNAISGEAVEAQSTFGLIEKYASRLNPLEAIPAEKLAELFPSATVLRIAHVHTLFGQAYLSQGNRFQARYHLERATELNPANKQTRLTLSRLHYAQQNFPLALAVIETHLNIFPEDAVAKFHREDCVKQIRR